MQAFIQPRPISHGSDFSSGKVEQIMTSVAPLVGPHRLAYFDPDYRFELIPKLRDEIRPRLINKIKSNKPDVDSACTEPMQEYLTHLHQAWADVLLWNDLIDRYFYNKSRGTLRATVMEELQFARMLLSPALDAEKSKDIYSGGLKSKLEIENVRLQNKFALTDDIALLMCPGFETFYGKYHFDHLRYFLDGARGDSNTVEAASLAENLINRFHGGDRKLFELRFASFGFAEHSRLNHIASLRQYDEMMRDVSIRKQYLLCERRELRLFESLLEYDNWTEYQYLYSFRPLPEAFMRKMLLNALKDHGIVGTTSNIFDFPNYVDWLGPLSDLEQKIVGKPGFAFNLDGNLL
jgi:hypothetical protein